MMINEVFLNQQILLGKTFYASHSILGTTNSFLKEINFLRKLDIGIFQL